NVLEVSLRPPIGVAPAPPPRDRPTSAPSRILPDAPRLRRCRLPRLRCGARRRIRLRTEVFNCLVGEQAEDRHRDRRHAAAATRSALPARPVLHAIEDVKQAHLCLLSRPFACPKASAAV